MSKLILEFSIPEETEDAQMAQDAWKYKLVIEDLYSFIRSQVKYENKVSIKFEALREKLNEIYNDHFDNR